MSPHHHILREKFLPIYLERLEQGENWPGIITNMHEYNQEESRDIPDFLHVFDDKLMQELLTKIGFKIEEINLFDYSNNSANQKGYSRVCSGEGLVSL